MNAKQEHNYKRKLLRMVRDGSLPIGTELYHVDVYHDDDCSIFEGRFCDCDPDIELKSKSGGRSGKHGRQENGAGGSS